MNHIKESSANRVTANLKRTPTFLQLPGEIKNIIYRYTLLDNEITIPAGSTPPLEPPLLRTCRQLRTEARSIYYLEATFGFEIANLDTTIFQRWCARSELHKQAHMSIALVGQDRDRDWPNLLIWIKARCEGRCGKPTIRPETLSAWPRPAQVEMLAITQYFEIAAKVCEGNGGVCEWKAVEGALEKAHGLALLAAEAGALNVSGPVAPVPAPPVNVVVAPSPPPPPSPLSVATLLQPFFEPDETDDTFWMFATIGILAIVIVGQVLGATGWFQNR